MSLLDLVVLERVPHLYSSVSTVGVRNLESRELERVASSGYSGQVVMMVF
jgi:hypothetical protein